MTRPLGRRSLDEHVAQGRGAGRAGRQHRPGERARTRSGVDHHVGVRAAELEPPLVEGAGHDRAEERADLRRREEVAPPAGPATGCVEAARRVVEGRVDELLERDRAVSADPVVQASREVVGRRQLPAGTSVVSPPNRSTMLGSTPMTTVARAVITIAALSDCGTLIGASSPSGAGSIHIFRATLA